MIASTSVRRRVVEAAVIAGAIALTLLFFFGAGAKPASACSYPGAPDCDMNPPPPPPGSGGHNGGGGGSNSCSCVNGVCSGNACPKSSPPPPPPPPPAGNFAPPPPPSRTSKPVPPPPPAGNFAPDLPATPTQTPTAAVGADPPRADIAPTPAPDGKLIANTSSGNKPNTGGEAAGAAAAGAGALAFLTTVAKEQEEPEVRATCLGCLGSARKGALLPGSDT